MNKLVVITKEQAEAIKSLVTDGWSYKEILESHINLEKEGRLWTRYAGLNGMNFDTLVKALYNTYEVEQTPEEELTDLYKHCTEKNFGDMATGIERTLNILGIEIEGVNK